MAIRQPNGSAHVRVLSEHPRFDARSNYPKSNRLRGAPVPNVYLFGTVSTKIRRNRPLDDEPDFRSTGSIQSRRGEGVTPWSPEPVNRSKTAPESLPPEITPILAAGAEEGDAYPTPKNARKGRFRPKKQHSTQDDPAETFHPYNDLAENRPNPVM